MEQYLPFDVPQLWQVAQDLQTPVNVREAPNTESRRLGAHIGGEVVQVVGKFGQWLHIKNDGQYPSTTNAWMLAFHPTFGTALLKPLNGGFPASKNLQTIQTMEMVPQVEYVPMQITTLQPQVNLVQVPQQPQIEFMHVQMPPQIEFVQMPMQGIPPAPELLHGTPPLKERVEPLLSELSEPERTLPHVQEFVQEVAVPLEKLVVKQIPVPKDVIVEKIEYREIPVPIEKIIQVPIEKIVDRPIPVEKFIYVDVTAYKFIEEPTPAKLELPKENERTAPRQERAAPAEPPRVEIVEKIVEVETVGEIVEHVVEVTVPRVVETVVEVPVDRVVERRVEVPVERIIEKIVYEPVQYVEQPVYETRRRTVQVPVMVMQEQEIEETVEVGRVPVAMSPPATNMVAPKYSPAVNYISPMTTLDRSSEVGIGLALQRRDLDDFTYVDGIIPGFAAERSGQFQIGDILEAINGIPVTGWSLDAIKNLTIGPEGSPVNLNIRRGGSVFVVSLIRQMPTASPGRPYYGEANVLIR